MGSLLLRWLINAFSLWIVGSIIPGITIKGFGSALLAVIVIGLVNAFLGPLLAFLALPANVLTLGLFSFVVNAILLMIAAAIAPDFQVDGLVSAILGSILLSIVSTFLHRLLV